MEAGKKTEKKATKKVAKKPEEKEEEKKPTKKATKKTTKKVEEKVEVKAEEKVEVKVEAKAEKKTPKKAPKKASTTKKATKKVEAKEEAKPEEKVEVKEEDKKAEKKPAKKASKKPAKKVEEKIAEKEEKVEEKVEEKRAEDAAEEKPAKKAAKKPAKKAAKKADKKTEEKPAEEQEEKVAEEEAVTEKTVEEVAEEEEREEESKPSKKGGPRVKEKSLECILDLNASNVWELSERAIANAWEKEREEEDFSISEQKLLNIIRLAFEVVHFNPANKREAARFEDSGWAKITHCNESKGCVAFRRKTIERITDLSYENVKHISTAMLLELISRNFGGGWESLSLSVRDIIESGFDISTTQLPASRIHAPGGTLEKKVAQGFEVLEIPKGTWVEAIFAKKKDPIEKLHMELPEREYDEDGNPLRYQDEIDTADEAEADNSDNDDTYFSSISPEAEVSDMEEEGLSIEDVNEEEEE